MIDKAYLEARKQEIQDEMTKLGGNLNILQGMFFEVNNQLIKLQEAEKTKDETTETAKLAEE